MRSGFVFFAGLVAAMTVTGSSIAQTAKTPITNPGYGVDLISVAVANRHNQWVPSGDCVVWANAEGLGVKLGDLHGLTMDFNPHPLPGEQPLGFDTAMMFLHRAYPDAPAWMFAALEKNRAAIEAACAGDHPIPVRIYTLTARDKAN